MTGGGVSEGFDERAASDGPEDDEDRVGIEGTVRVEFGARLRVLGRGADERRVLQDTPTARLGQFRSISRFGQQRLPAAFQHHSINLQIIAK